jgi:hypothetical protein
VVFHEEGVTTTVTVTREVDYSLSKSGCWVRHALLVNGKPDASLSVLRRAPTSGHCADLAPRPLRGPGIRISPAGDAETQVLSGLLPVCLHPGARGPRSALVIGWGSGITAGALLQSGISRAIAVELEEEVLRGARHFQPHNHTPARDDRLMVVNEDGRNYLANIDRELDIIISEPSNPWISGCGNLFTREFFELVSRRLAPKGVFLQWLQAYEIAPENVWSILGTLADTFPSVHVFRPVNASSDLLIVARMDDAPLQLQSIERCMAEAPVQAELDRIGVVNPWDIVVRLLAAPEGIRAVTAGAPRNTDDNARIEFAAPKDLINYERYSADAIGSSLGETLSDPRLAFGDIPPHSASNAVCWAAVRAGKWKLAFSLAEQDDAPHPGSDLRHCLEVTAKMEADPDPPEETLLAALLPPQRAGLAQVVALDPPGRALAAVLEQLSPTRDAHAGFAILGHLAALRGDTRDSLLFLLAARVLEASGSPHYAPLEPLLARQYRKVGRYRRALEMLRAAPQGSKALAFP